MRSEGVGEGGGAFKLKYFRENGRLYWHSTYLAFN